MLANRCRTVLLSAQPPSHDEAWPGAAETQHVVRLGWWIQRKARIAPSFEDERTCHGISPATRSSTRRFYPGYVVREETNRNRGTLIILPADTRMRLDRHLYAPRPAVLVSSKSGVLGPTLNPPVNKRDLSTEKTEKLAHFSLQNRAFRMPRQRSPFQLENIRNHEGRAECLG